MSDKSKTADSTEVNKSHVPGLPVPTVSLAKALELAGKFWEHEKRNAAPVPAVLGHWNYGLKSSGGFMAVASLKRYGLLEEQGSKEKRTLKLSQLALDILKNSTTDTQEYYRLLGQAAMHPKAHRDLWAKYGAELPSDATLENYLVFDRRLGEAAAKQFIRVYKDTISFARITGDEAVKELVVQEETTSSGKSDAKAPLVHTVSPQTMSPWQSIPQGPLLPLQNPATKYFAIPTDIGDAMIPMGMSEADFNLFEKALTLFKPKIIRNTRFPVGAIWKNNDSDKPVTIVGEMGEKDGKRYFKSQDGTGIPESELTFA